MKTNQRIEEFPAMKNRTNCYIQIFSKVSILKKNCKREREKNIVISGISISDQAKSDVVQICMTLDTNFKEEPNESMKAFGGRENKKLIRITFKATKHKLKILKNTRKMRTRANRKLFINPDLNKQQQQEKFQLRTALKEKLNKKPEMNHFIRKRKIIPTNIKTKHDYKTNARTYRSSF